MYPDGQNSNQSQYDFILNNGPMQPKRGLGGFGNSTKARIIVVAGGLILLIILAVVVINLLNSGSKSQTQKLTDVARSQAELVRVATLSKDAKDLNTISLATTTKLSIASTHNSTKQLLVKRGVSSKDMGKVLGGSKNPKTDAALTEAAKNNRFDETFIKLLDTQLSDYRKLLAAAHGGANNNERKLIEAEIKNIEAIQQQTQKKPGAPVPVKASDIEEAPAP